MSMPEDLFKSEFENYGEQPPSRIWGSISRKLAWRRFLSFSPSSLNIYYAAALLVAASAVTYRLAQPPAQQEQAAMAENQYAPKGMEDKPAASEAYEKNKSREQGSKAPLMQKYYSAPGADLGKNDGIRGDKKDGAPAAGSLESTADFSCDFALDARRGCAPFTVTTKNLSGNYDYCQWSLGNGEISYDAEPCATYREPGTYIISLKTVSGTSAKTMHDTIVVAAAPRAEMACAQNMGKVVLEARHSSGNRIAWDFGDGKGAQGAKVAHKYDKAGHYTVRLVVRNGMCSDSAARDICVNEPEYSITFPNAVTYSNALLPKGNVGEIAKYSLSVYTRNGREVFSTQNPQQGWNGYCNGERLPAGAYAYRAQYEFVNGDKNAVTGSVVLLRESQSY